MLAERRVTPIGRVDEGVALVESPAGFYADLLGRASSCHLQLRAERDLETGGDDSGVRGRVIQDGTIATARQEDGPAAAIGREIAGERLAQLLVRPEGGGRVAVGRHEQVEGVARDDKCARAFDLFEGVGELQ